MKHNMEKNSARLALNFSWRHASGLATGRRPVATACFLLLAGIAAPQTRSALEINPTGWRDILPDASFKGWTRVPIPPTATLTPESHWSLDPVQHTVICNGDKTGHEWLRYDHALSDFLFHVEFSFTPIRMEKPRYNSGIFVRNSADGKAWHQAQIGSANGGYIFGVSPVNGELTHFNLAKQMKEQRVKPAGEWNSCEIRCEGRKISLWVNGAVTSEFEECDLPQGYLGLEAEGYRIEFRNLKVKQLE